MKKFLTYLIKPFWWRKYYYKAYISEGESWKGRCIICQAHSLSSPLTCDSLEYRDCPCKMNQRLVLKHSDFVIPQPEERPAMGCNN